MKKEKQPLPYYPMFLDISGKRCVVVGGGQVALRKVNMLLEHGADVEVISLDFCSELSDLADSGEIRILHRNYQAGDLKDALIVIASTSDENTNMEIARDARSNVSLVNVVDDPEKSDFIVPSYLRRGDVTIAISTSGRSPALARKIRTKLEKEFGDEYASLALVIDKVRTELRQQGIKVDGDIWQEALDLDLAIELLKKGDDRKIETILLSSLKRRQK